MHPVHLLWKQPDERQGPVPYRQLSKICLIVKVNGETCHTRIVRPTRLVEVIIYNGSLRRPSAKGHDGVRERTFGLREGSILSHNSVHAVKCSARFAIQLRGGSLYHPGRSFLRNPCATAGVPWPLDNLCLHTSGTASQKTGMLKREKVASLSENFLKHTLSLRILTQKSEKDLGMVA